MQDVKVTLSIMWIAVMLTYLWGDVLRIFSGDVVLGEIDGAKFTQAMGLGIEALMVIPILMVVLSLMLSYNINRWANIIAAVGWFLFNLAGIRGYPGHYDKFLLAVSMGFNVITVWYAWKSVAQVGSKHAQRSQDRILGHLVRHGPASANPRQSLPHIPRRQVCPQPTSRRRAPGRAAFCR
jgi:hypothetical protein